jgi:hypothetical protein
VRSDRKAVLNAEAQIARERNYDVDLLNGLEKRLRRIEGTLWTAPSKRLCFVERSGDSLIFHQPNLVGSELFSYVSNALNKVIPNAMGDVRFIGHPDLLILLDVTADPNQ